MKRLLQLGTLLLMLAPLLPLHELFETEDEPGGVGGDAEFAFFALAFAVCLVLLVCKLIAMGLLKVCMISLRAIQRAQTARHRERGYTFIFQVPPLFLVPLRI
jgi:hypothetical protein